MHVCVYERGVCVNASLFLCSDAEKRGFGHLSVPLPAAVLLTFIMRPLPRVVSKRVFLDEAHVFVIFK